MATNYVNSLPTTCKYIDDTDNEYIDIDGNVYKINNKNKIIKKKLYKNKNGYMYVGLVGCDGKRKSYRVHRVVAQAFIPNPDNLDVVGHKNNIKSDNQVGNLYWTTIQENTQKSFDDGCQVNDKGINDTQSTPVGYYLNGGKLLSVYGSRVEASKYTKRSKSTICRQSNENVSHGKFGYYFKTISEKEYHDTDDKFKNVKF